MDIELRVSGEIVDVRDGTHDSPKYVDEGFPLITSKNLKEGKIVLDDVNYVTKEDYNKINKRSKVDKGDILYSMIGTIGNFSLVEEEPVFAIKNVALFKFTSSEVFNRYFLYVLSSDFVKQQIELQQKGGTQKFVTLKILRNLKIPLPPLKTQQRIAAILDDAAALRDKTAQLLTEYDLLAQSIFLEMFGDPFNNQNNFELGTIRDLVREAKYGTSAKAGGIGQFSYLRMNNLTYSGHMDYEKLKYVDIPQKDIEKYIVRKGDILFNRTNSRELVGKTAIFDSDTEMVAAGYLIRVRINELGNPYFIWGYLNSKHGKLILNSMCKNIVGMANINAQELQNIKILLPPINLQNEFADKVALIEQQKALAKQELQESEDLFNCLLQQAFKGELV
jgi:type I restriction enzyme S subunit